MAKTTTLQTISNQMADVVEQSAPYLVKIKARRRVAATGISLGNGLIMTANHVVHKEEGIAIGLHDGETTADLAGRDPRTDLAILKTTAKLDPFPVADASGRVGELVLALARPTEHVQATLGIISAINATKRRGGRRGRGRMPLDSYIQTDVLMYPGFSGGPLVNASGAMLGMNTSGFSRGHSMTIPLAAVQSIVDSLAQHGRVRRAYLGVKMQTVALPANLQTELEQEGGLLIMGVEPSSPAESAGLVLGDTITAVADQPVQNHHDLMGQLDSNRIGEKTPFSIVRGGKLETINLMLTARE